VVRNEAIMAADEEDRKKAIERAKAKLQTLPNDAFAAGDPEEAAKRIAALAGQHMADSSVHARDRGRHRRLQRQGMGARAQPRARASSSARSMSSIAMILRRPGSRDLLLPVGVGREGGVEITDGSDVFSTLVYGLTGRVELLDSELKDINDHMLKNVMGDHDAKREDQK